MRQSKITIHMVASLDGFIAKKDNSVDWMASKDHYERGKVLTEKDIADYLKGIDCYIMGAKTYEHALTLGWPYGDKPVFVMSSRSLTKERPSVIITDEPADSLVERLKSMHTNIWMVGGAQLTKTFLKKGLADEIIVTIIPVLLGDGTLYFDFIGVEQELHLKDVTAYKEGMVELTYEIKKIS